MAHTVWRNVFGTAGGGTVFPSARWPGGFVLAFDQT
jgi:hypothetical protein